MRCMQFMVSITLIAKICNEKTRGTMYAFNGIMMSLGITILQGFGGDLYENVSKLIPFLYWYVGYIFLTLLTLVLMFKGALKA